MTDKPDPNIQQIDPRSDLPPSAFGAGQSVQNDIRTARIEVMATADDKVNIAEPPTPNHPRSPYNKVYHSPSGHLIEYDDTPGAERILIMHKSGSFTEIHPQGDNVTKIFGKDYHITLDDENIFVGGTRNITVQGDATFLCAGDVTQKIGGNLNTIVNGDHITRVAGKTLHYSKGPIDIQSAAAINMFTTSTISLQSMGQLSLNSGANLVARAATTAQYFSVGITHIDGSSIYENSGGADPGAGTLKSLDPTSGLTIPQSLIQPSLESQFAVRTDNNVLVPTISAVTFPRDRIKNNN